MARRSILSVLRLANQAENNLEVNPEYKDSKGIYDPVVLSHMYPVDPLTGFCWTDLGRIMSDSMTDAEKESVMARLKRVDGRYLPEGLSDDEIYQIVPPRYLQDANDVDRWRTYLSDVVLAGFDNDAKSRILPESENVPQAEEPHKIE